MTDHERRPHAPDVASRVNRFPAQQREAERQRAYDAVEATFPAPSEATADELVQMAIHALRFDGASLAASLGIARSQGEALVRAPGTLSGRHRALLAQYLEMGGDPQSAERNRAIAARLRASLAERARSSDAERNADTGRNRDGARPPE